MKLRFFAIAAIACLAHAADSGKVVGGPYVVNVGPRTATVMWVEQSGEVRLGTAPDKAEKTGPALRAQRTTFTGLTPGALYYYDSFGGDAGKGRFRTPPAAGTPEGARFEFVVFGDTRTRHDVHRQVIEGVLKFTNPEFVLHTGDLVADGTDNSQWPVFFDIERELLRKTVFYPALGNHERNAKNYVDFMNTPLYYSFDWGGAHFSGINTDLGNAARTEADKQAFWMEQTRWLEADLIAAQKADHRFLFGHHPPMTAAKGRQGENPHVMALELMLQKYKVSAAFFGHDHNYQHFLKNGVHYFITGGGGAPLADVDMPPAGITQKVEKVENFVNVLVEGKTVRIEGRRPDGSIIERTEWTAK